MSQVVVRPEGAITRSPADYRPPWFQPFVLHRVYSSLYFVHLTCKNDEG